MSEAAEAIEAEERATEAEAEAFAARLKASGRLGYVLAALCGAMFALQLLWSNGSPTGFVDWHMGAGDREALVAGELWRLVTPTFLHVNAVHIAFNIYALVLWMPIVEAVFGRTRAWLIFFSGAVGSSLLSALMLPNALSVGASGAIWALLAARGVVILGPFQLAPPGFAAKQKSALVSALGLNALISLSPGIDGAGHLGGGLLGGLVAWWFARSAAAGASPVSANERRLAWGLAAVTLACVLVALATGRPWELAAPQPARRELPGMGLTAEIPPLLRQTEAYAKDGWRYATWGSLRSDPMLVSVSTHALSAESVALGEDAFLAESYADLAALPPDYHGRVLAKPQQRAFGPRQGLVASWELAHGTILERHVLRVGSQVVWFDVYQGKSAPPAWIDLAPRIVASVSESPAP